jgi:predicted RNA-binding Zn-ribbon protein involved in translation (DUF1610 family)
VSFRIKSGMSGSFTWTEADSLADLADAGFGMAGVPVTETAETAETPTSKGREVAKQFFDRLGQGFSPSESELATFIDAALWERNKEWSDAWYKHTNKCAPGTPKLVGWGIDNLLKSHVCPRCGSNTRPRADEHPLTPQPVKMPPNLSYLITTAISAEREACAKLVEDGADDARFECPVCASQIAHAIRARSKPSSPPSP